MTNMTLSGAMCWVDGQPGAGVSPFDRGLAFGDGLFETMRFGPAGIPLLDLHMRRLEHGCSRLGIAVSIAQVTGEIALALDALRGSLAEGVLKLIVTRGAGGRGYRADAAMRATRVLTAAPLPAYSPTWPTDGVAVRFCELRLGASPALAGVKHLNRLEQVVARREWDDPDIAEGLMADARGRIVEGVATNVFLASGGRLLTPVIDTCGVAGVMRAFILERAAPALGLAITETGCERALLAGAQEMFLCNAVVGVWPVRRLATRVLSVGPLTRRVQAYVAAAFGH